MSEPREVESIDRISFAPRAADSHSRAAGSPLSVGAGRSLSEDSPESGTGRNPAGPPGRALPASTASDEASGLGRALNAIRAALPVAQRLLPLLDGNVVAAVLNLLSPHHHPTPSPAPKVDLAPVENWSRRAPDRASEFTRPGHRAERFSQACRRSIGNGARSHRPQHARTAGTA